MKRKSLIILGSVLVILSLILMNCIHTSYKTSDGKFRILTIQTSFRLVAMPGDGGSNNSIIILVNKFWFPLKKWESKWYDLRYRFGEMLHDKDSSVLFMDQCFEGCSPVRYVVYDWKVKETELNYEDYSNELKKINHEILNYYKKMSRGRWISKEDTIEIQGDIFHINNKSFDIKWIRNYKENYNKLFGDSVTHVIYNCDEIGIDVSDTTEKFYKIENIDYENMYVYFIDNKIWELNRKIVFKRQEANK